MWERTQYRVGQFLHGWRATVSAEDHAQVREVLEPAGPQAVALFNRMPRDAQAHSLRVLRALQTDILSPHPLPPDLAAAALLHDVGKIAASEAGAYLGLWLRGPLVLLEKWRPRLLVQWASPQPAPNVRYSFYVHCEHPHLGAEMARLAGCSTLTCWLIAHHQEHYRHEDGTALGDSPRTATAYHYLARLQWADGRN
jgi:hypothetical protein